MCVWIDVATDDAKFLMEKSSRAGGKGVITCVTGLRRECRLHVVIYIYIEV